MNPAMEMSEGGGGVEGLSGYYCHRGSRGRGEGGEQGKN